MKGEFRFSPNDYLKEFDEFLARHKVKFEATLIGSGAVHLLGIENKTTVDIDILEPGIPENIKNLAEEFRQQKEKNGFQVRPNWFSDGANIFLKNYPKGWQKRTTVVFKGKALTLRAFGREEMIKEKLWGFCEGRDQDLKTLLALKPKPQELKAALPWIEAQGQTTPFWPDIIARRLKELLKEIGFDEKDLS